MNIGFPWQLDFRGRTAIVDDETHIRHLIEQVLFTAPGERVNRPTFGSGLQRLLFAPGSNELASATQIVVQGALQQWLGDLIEVEGTRVTVEDARISVTVKYKVRRTQSQHVLEVSDVL